MMRTDGRLAFSFSSLYGLSGARARLRTLVVVANKSVELPAQTRESQKAKRVVKRDGVRRVEWRGIMHGVT